MTKIFELKTEYLNINKIYLQINEIICLLKSYFFNLKQNIQKIKINQSNFSSMLK